MSDISKNIKRCRRKSGLTQEQLALKLNVTRQAVSNWENDKSYPDLDLVVTLANVLNTDPNSLLYPEQTEKKVPVFHSVSLKPVLWTFLLFSFAMTWGSGPAVWLLEKILGGGVRETYLYPIYWGILLLAVLIVLCTCVIVEEIRNFGNSSAEEKE